MSYTPTEWESTDVVTATRLNALEQAVGDLNMSYTPNVWQNGDILTADKMNALEQAVASGGGGSSDFSTATVTITSDASYFDMQFDVCPVLTAADVLWEGSPASIAPLYIESSQQTETVPLYMGTCLWNFMSPDINAQVTGSITVNELGVLIITGDGTITISPID